MKISLPALMAALCLFWVPGPASADPPHDFSSNVQCADCHTLHKAPGPGLTRVAENQNLCMSCHRELGSASGKPFTDPMQASPGSSGTSHRWDGTMPAPPADPNSPFGLRPAEDLTDTILQTRVQGFGATVCSVCHAVHYQTEPPWDPVAPTVPGEEGRHLMLSNNLLNELCKDCHFYRTTAAQTDTRTYDGNKKSHPIGRNLTTEVANPTQFVGAAPLEPESASWAAQTGARYHLNGGTDTNVYNNLVLDENGDVQCLSCHGVHYCDSDSATEDVP